MALRKKGSKKLGTYFAVTTSLLVAIAVYSTAAYSTNIIKIVIKEYNAAVANYNNYMTTSIIKSFSRDIQSGEFNEMSDTVNFLKMNEYISYAYIYNIRGGKIMWSSDPMFKNNNNKNIQETVLPEINKKTNVQTREIALGSYGLVLGFINSKLEDSTYKRMFDNLNLFLVLFLVIGVTASAFLSNMINKPLLEMSEGAQEFGKGNLKYRLQYTGYDEVDQLVTSYNMMGSQLSELYESMENKVEERTQELKKSNEKLKQAQVMMVHAEKMRSLGELVAGIAHEINNPINFIYGNIVILDNYQKDLLALIDKYTEVEDEINPLEREKIQQQKDLIDIEFLKSDIKDLIASCLEGVERTKNIIIDLKNFSRIDKMVFAPCDVAKEIDTTLNILNNKLKDRITIHKNYGSDVPQVEAYVGQINQAFMNILDNAQSSIENRGDIYITTKLYDDDNILIEFEDTGCGIEKDNIKKVFEPFYTTKPAGKGTGLGLSIVYKVIESHNGKIKIDSTVGQGTKVSIILPIEQKKEEKS